MSYPSEHTDTEYEAVVAARDRLAKELRQEARFLRWVAGNYKLVHFPGLVDRANEIEAAANKEAPAPD